MKTKLSIIIPYYKTLELLNELLAVLIPQITEEVEVIIIDDGCNEWSLDKMEKVRVIHKANGGVSSARNIGLDNINGENIGFIDSDDMIPEYYISKILNKINTTDFEYCLLSWKYKTGEEIIITEESPWWNTCVWNCIYKKDLIGNSRFDTNLDYGEDSEFNLLVKHGKRENITDIMYIYNSNRKDSLSYNKLG